MTNNPDERDILARDAFNLLAKIPDSADLSAICKRFENLRSVICCGTFSLKYIIPDNFLFSYPV